MTSIYLSAMTTQSVSYYVRLVYCDACIAPSESDMVSPLDGDIYISPARLI